MEYWQKLKDPRWQKKRLEILERDKWTCRHCESTVKTLNVHHRVYEKGADPWDYEDDDLMALCEDCHVQVTKLGKGLMFACSYRVHYSMLKNIVGIISSREDRLLHDIVELLVLHPNMLGPIRALLDQMSQDEISVLLEKKELSETLIEESILTPA